MLSAFLTNRPFLKAFIVNILYILRAHSHQGARPISYVLEKAVISFFGVNRAAIFWSFAPKRSVGEFIMKYIDVVIVVCCALFPLAALASVPIPGVIPEPGTLSLIAIGAAAAGATGYLKRRKK
jgi:hypothetical protein